MEVRDEGVSELPDLFIKPLVSLKPHSVQPALGYDSELSSKQLCLDTLLGYYFVFCYCCQNTFERVGCGAVDFLFPSRFLARVRTKLT